MLIFWTLLATKESNKAAWAAIKLMRAMSEKELRAYIMVEHIELLDRDGGGPPQFIVMLKNTGQTPATNINQFVAFGCVDMASQPISNFRDSKGNLPRLPQFIIGAGMTHPISVGLRRPIDEEVSDAMWAIELKVFGSGIITYDDVFGKRRRTIFKFHLGQTPNQGYVTIPDKKNNRIS
ncbi:MAG: hypothetical protein COA47_14455 [Robiginitomaculum sp.]|nr:MAG: hypothetical protein COA47_14455 [Robiginitomaculum sp.]